MQNTASRLGIQAFYSPPSAPRRPRIRRAEGIWFEDETGRRTIDVSAGPVASNLGHGNARVLAAMQAQAALASFAFPTQFESAADRRRRPRQGLLLAVELVADKATKRMIPPERNAPERLKAIGLEHGLMLYGRRTAGGAFGEWLMVRPPLVVTAAEVDDIADRLAAALGQYEDELTREGAL